MEILQKIKINDLLMKREAFFAKVYQAEHLINQIASPNKSFNFPPPEIIPLSAIPKSKQKKQKKKKKQQLRKLKKNEYAYKISYFKKTEKKEVLLKDDKIIKLIMDSTTLPLKITKIETVSFSEDGSETIIEDLIFLKKE
ncbi:MAG: hypothetical protein U9O87_08110 [Verrucomicrobiota bacterium]|nr:hypothetical protein [Verrucomicrobiota bacterium]